MFWECFPPCTHFKPDYIEDENLTSSGTKCDFSVSKMFTEQKKSDPFYIITTFLYTLDIIIYNKNLI